MQKCWRRKIEFGKPEILGPKINNLPPEMGVEITHLQLGILAPNHLNWGKNNGAVLT